MKKSIILFGLGALTLAFSSCLKDQPLVDFATVKPFVEIVHSGTARFAEAGITDSEDTIARTLTVNVTGEFAPTSDVQVTIGVDNSVIATYNAANPSVVYEAMPTGSFVFPDQTVTIKAGTRLADFPVTFYRALLDPSKSYMLPIVIKSATGSGVSLSQNYNVIYYHFIGNDFAGTYKHQFTRTPAAGNYLYAAGNTSTFLPTSATQFEVAGGYYTGTIRYRVSFQKSATGTYSNFTVVISPADVTDILTANSIAISTAPSIVGYVEKSYTKAEALALFDQGFQYDVLGSSGGRHNLDQYKK